MTSGAVLSRKSSQVKQTHDKHMQTTQERQQDSARCSRGKKAKNVLKKATNSGIGLDLTYSGSQRRNGRGP